MAVVLSIQRWMGGMEASLPAGLLYITYMTTLWVIRMLLGVVGGDQIGD